MSRDLYDAAIRPLLFQLDAEQAHDRVLAMLRYLQRTPFLPELAEKQLKVADPRLRTDVFGLAFANPVGIAAGFDKNGVVVPALAALGFGHVEVGTVTLEPQEGNPRPRVFRLPEDGALINRMGFPNQGVEALCDNLSRVARDGTIVGINIGKGRATALERAADDYCRLLERVYPHADYVAVNVSSPNTPGLRALQERAQLEDLIGQLAAVQRSLTTRLGYRRPLVIKIAPDLAWSEIDDVLTVLQDHHLDGIIATNTMAARPNLRDSARDEQGGLSGRPLRNRATAIVHYVYRQTNGRVPIVGVGGVCSPADALAMIQAGASLVQLYTGFIYAGPTIAATINRTLSLVMDRLGVASIAELVGSGEVV